MKLRQEFATNTDLETEGVWQDLGDGGRVKVARLGNPKWQRAYNKLPHGLRNAASSGRLKGAQADEFDKRNARVLAETILLDWDGMEEEDGTPIPYSVEAAEQALFELKDFRTAVVQLAGDMANFQAEEVAEKGKGSRGSSKSS